MPADPDILVDLTTAASEFEAGVIVEALRNQGIHAESFTTAGAVLQWEVAVSQPFRVVVRRADLERAREALRAIKADSVDLDWNEVDTGDHIPEVRGQGPNWGSPKSWLLGLFTLAIVFGAIALGLYLVHWLNWTPPEDTGRQVQQ